MLEDHSGGSRSLIARSGGNTNNLIESLKKIISNLPKLTNPTGEVGFSSELGRVLNLTDKENLKIAELLYEHVGTKDIVVRLNDEFVSLSPRVNKKILCHWLSSRLRDETLSDRVANLVVGYKQDR